MMSLFLIHQTRREVEEQIYRTMILKAIMWMVIVLMLADVHTMASISYGITHKENISENAIRLVIYIQNNNRQDIEPGTVYDISINEYEGKFTVAKTIQKNCTGKGIIYTYGDLSQDRFKDVYCSNTEQLNFSMKESDNKDSSIPA